MNQNPLSGGSLPTRLDDADLFGQALNRIHDDPPVASDASLTVNEWPRLSLVQPDDNDDSSTIEDAAAMDEMQSSPLDDIQSATARSVDHLDDDYGELWMDHEVKDTASAADAANAESDPAVTIPEINESFDLGDLTTSLDHFISQDQSATECITITNPLATDRPDAVAEAPEPTIPTESQPASKPTAALGLPNPAPHRIGSGKLAPAKLTWKPGDPFGSSGGSPRGRFRWELMLTTACVTAICGLGCIWLLRTILA